MSAILTGNRQRISSIDTLRGLIMVIMALDHVRDYFHITAITSDPTNLATTTPALFFTRWITHFCAPLFVFLSGLSAYLSGQNKTKKELSIFLIKRGLWLIVVDVVVVSFIMTFNPTYNFIILTVIWVIGWSMVILGCLVRGSYRLVLITGLILFTGHNLLDYLDLPATGAASAAWQILFTTPGSVFPIGDGRIVLIAYAILPWASIMLLGYAAGMIYKPGFDPTRRKRILIATGAGMILLFLLLRGLNLYGDPTKWSEQDSFLYTLLSFLRVTKYPVSLQFACMTIGPGLIFLALMENVRNGLTSFLTVYGRVPFFYYIGHFLLAHLLCMADFFRTGHSFAERIDPASPFLFRLSQGGYELGIVYGVWLLVVLLMYYPCRWYGNYKLTHREWWLSYL